MQLTLNRRFSNGWTLNTNYTVSMNDGMSLGLIPYNLPQDRRSRLRPRPLVTALSRRGCTSCRTSERTRSSTACFGGWQVTGVFQFQSGGWLSINSGTDRSLDGLGSDRAVRIDGVPLEAAEPGMRDSTGSSGSIRRRSGRPISEPGATPTR